MLQERIALPSIAAENLNYPKGAHSRVSKVQCFSATGQSESNPAEAYLSHRQSRS
jgi:hypothetical protein